ncbi:MAG: DUF2232 domain-containing protein [Candidatus Electrothrix sp. AR3]|nr:DUF2232 domain-containing protein [Candidatus Electrothrix sp. AR3]
MLDKSLEHWITQLEFYSAHSDLQAEAQYNLKIAVQAISGMRTVLLPKILPGLLAGTTVVTVWLNMVTANYLLHKIQPKKAAWPAFRYWQLPDKLIWLLIAALALSLTAIGNLQTTGYCLTIVSVLLYFLQGVAIFVHLLNRWNIPIFWRIILYIIMAQSYGLFILTVAGIADTWANFRKLGQEEETAC